MQDAGLPRSGNRGVCCCPGQLWAGALDHSPVSLGAGRQIMIQAANLPRLLLPVPWKVVRACWCPSPALFCMRCTVNTCVYRCTQCTCVWKLEEGFGCPPCHSLLHHLGTGCLPGLAVHHFSQSSRISSSWDLSDSLLGSQACTRVLSFLYRC